MPPAGVTGSDGPGGGGASPGETLRGDRRELGEDLEEQDRAPRWPGPSGQDEALHHRPAVARTGAPRHRVPAAGPVRTGPMEIPCRAWNRPRTVHRRRRTNRRYAGSGWTGRRWIRPHGVGAIRNEWLGSRRVRRSRPLAYPDNLSVRQHTTSVRTDGQAAPDPGLSPYAGGGFGPVQDGLGSSSSSDGKACKGWHDSLGTGRYRWNWRCRQDRRRRWPVRGRGVEWIGLFGSGVPQPDRDRIVLRDGLRPAKFRIDHDFPNEPDLGYARTAPADAGLPPARARPSAPARPHRGRPRAPRRRCERHDGWLLGSVAGMGSASAARAPPRVACRARRPHHRCPPGCRE